MSLFSFKSYAILTIASVIYAIYNSYNQHKQFYTTVIHLSSNKVYDINIKINRSIFINFLLMITAKFMISYLSFTFGELREIERLVSICSYNESVIERAKRKIVDIALMLLIFREDFDIYFMSTTIIII